MPQDISSIRIELQALPRWLAQGWRDFLASKMISTVLSTGFVVLGAVATGFFLYHDRILLIVPLLTGFMLLGPVMVLGYYQIAERLRHGERPVWRDIWYGFWRAGASIWIIAFILGFCFLVWITDALLIYVLYFGTESSASLPPLLTDALIRGDTARFLFFGSVTGFCLALAIFAISVFSIPLIFHRHYSFTVAIGVSVRLVFNNPVAMASWALVIAIMGFIGLFLLPLFVVVLPVLAYASYEAYLDVLGDRKWI